MSSTYSTNLAIELIGTGDQAGTWGTTTNSNLGTLIEQSISGYVTQAVSTGTDTTITIPNGSSGVARNMYIELTGTGGSNTNLIVPANKKLYFIFNNSSGAVTVKVSGQTGVSVPTGNKMVLVSNGTDIVNGLNYIADFASNSATITHLSATSATITNLTLTSLVISNLSIASANITTLTSASATITNLLATSLAVSSIATFAAGSAAAPSITTTGDTNTGIFFPAADTIAFTEGGVESMRIDSSGNVGLGVTPSAFSGAGKNMQFGNGPASIGTQNSGDANFMHNAYESPNGTFKYVGSGIGALRYQLDINNNVHKWYYAASGTAGNAISFTQAMTLDSSGNLGIGTSSPAYKLDIAGNNYALRLAATTGTSRVAQFISNTSGQVSFGLESSAGGALFTGAGAYEGCIGTDVAKNFNIGTNGTVRATINSSGNLGIGTTSPSSRLSIVTPTSDATVGFNLRGYTTGADGLRTVSSRYTSSDDGNWANSKYQAWAHIWETNGTERARITSGGDWIAGSTTIPDGTNTAMAWSNSGDKSLLIGGSGTGGNQQIGFINGNGTVGSITTSGSATAYNTSSDVRLKKNIVDAQDSGADVDALQVRSFDWKSDNTHQRYGFIAQELVTVAPEAVYQPTDTEKMMGVDYSKLVPMLVKEVQLLRKRVAELESK